MHSGRVIEAIPTDQDLIRRRRSQLAHAALAVFSQKGFHKARVRDIALEAGVAVGTIYEYVSTKEDILYLACDQGFAEFEEKLREAIAGLTEPVDRLKAAIARYYQIMGELDTGILLLYRESQSLGKDGRSMLMRREEDIRQIFAGILSDGVDQGIFKIDNIKLVSHDIIMLGHMWGLKRWAIRNYLDLAEFIKLQTQLILSSIATR